MGKTIFIAADSLRSLHDFLGQQLPLLYRGSAGRIQFLADGVTPELSAIFRELGEVKSIGPTGLEALWRTPPEIRGGVCDVALPGVARLMTKRLKAACSGGGDIDRIVILNGDMPFYELQRQLVRVNDSLPLSDCRFIHLSELDADKDLVGVPPEGEVMPCEVLQFKKAELRADNKRAVTEKLNAYMTKVFSAPEELEALAERGREASIRTAPVVKELKKLEAVFKKLEASAPLVPSSVGSDPDQSDACVTLIKALAKGVVIDLVAEGRYLKGYLADAADDEVAKRQQSSLTRYLAGDEEAMTAHVIPKNDSRVSFGRLTFKMRDPRFFNPVYASVARELKEAGLAEVKMTRWEPEAALAQRRAPGYWAITLAVASGFRDFLRPYYQRAGGARTVVAATAVYAWWNGDLSDLTETLGPAFTAVVSSVAGTLFNGGDDAPAETYPNSTVSATATFS